MRPDPGVHRARVLEVAPSIAATADRDRQDAQAQRHRADAHLRLADRDVVVVGHQQVVEDR